MEEEKATPLSVAFLSFSSCFTGWPGVCVYKGKESEYTLERSGGIRKR